MKPDPPGRDEAVDTVRISSLRIRSNGVHPSVLAGSLD